MVTMKSQVAEMLGGSGLSLLARAGSRLLSTGRPARGGDVLVVHRSSVLVSVLATAVTPSTVEQEQYLLVTARLSYQGHPGE
jgi:hypothetical protein